MTEQANNNVDERRQGYWAIVRRQFFQRRLAVTGLIVVGLLLVLAFLAPLLANDRPIIAKYEGRLMFPALPTYLDAFPIPDGIVNWLRKSPTAKPNIWSNKYDELDGKTWKEVIREQCGIERDRFGIWNSGNDGSWFLMPPVPYAFDENDSSVVKARPSDPRLEGTKHYLGTDGNGRDVLSRMIHGTIVSMSVGVISVAIYCTLGVIIGALAGFFGGWVDITISRIIEVVLCFPTLFLILACVAIVGKGIYPIIVLLGLIRWTGPARLIRGEFLKAKTADYVMAAKALGLPAKRIIFRHLTPNCLAPVLVTATFGVAGAILVESSLSFLGFGVRIPTASWGEIGAQGRSGVSEGLYHLILYPGLATFVTVTAFNLVGEGLRDAMDPRLRS